jgi:hypothetical protein
MQVNALRCFSVCLRLLSLISEAHSVLANLFSRKHQLRELLGQVRAGRVSACVSVCGCVPRKCSVFPVHVGWGEGDDAGLCSCGRGVRCECRRCDATAVCACGFLCLHGRVRAARSAQSLTAARSFFMKRDPDAETRERRRRVPPHTFINVELLEACQVL